jgi:hypothetical protein
VMPAVVNFGADACFVKVEPILLFFFGHRNAVEGSIMTLWHWCRSAWIGCASYIGSYSRNTTGKPCLPCVRLFIVRRSKRTTNNKGSLSCVLFSSTRQKIFAVCFFVAHDKCIFFLFPTVTVNDR